MRGVHFFFSIAIVACFAGVAKPAGASHQTENVIFVMTDGLRWQEVFDGADAALMTEQNGVQDAVALKREFWRETAQERRETLMPFVWKTMARQGQIFGNRRLGAEAFVTNGLNFSYPGYSETLCGFPDARVKSNDKVLNPNVTMFEWLSHRPGFQRKVAAFGAWELFPFIFNQARAGFPVNVSYDEMASPATPTMALLNRIKTEMPRVWEDEAFDVLPFETAMEYLRVNKPRVLYLSLGETDDWAHAGNYPEYLRSAQRADGYLRKLWDAVQAMPEYRGKTTLVFSPDHGRGDDPDGWKTHGEKTPESKYIWMAFLGPDTRALGERSEIAAVTQNQIAATLAALLGEDYGAAVPKAGKVIKDVVGK